MEQNYQEKNMGGPSETLGNNTNPIAQTIILQQEAPKTNGIGTAGFIISLVAIFVGWIPILGWIVWFLGLILSFVGVFRKPKGMAIAGLVISLIGIIFLVFVFGVVLLAGLSR